MSGWVMASLYLLAGLPLALLAVRALRAQSLDLDSVSTSELIAELDKRLPYGSAHWAFHPIHARNDAGETAVQP